MEDKIEVIPSSMEKFLGCSGMMVRPSDTSVEAAVRKIRKGEIATLNQLREKIAQEFSVDTACPASTMKALLQLSHNDPTVPYWRVIKKNGELIGKFPDGIEAHAALLEAEGFSIDMSRKAPRVIDF